MSKIKIYADDTVFTYLLSNDVVSVSKFWTDLYSGVYDVYISDVTLELLNNCKNENTGIIFEFLDQIKYSTDKVIRRRTLARTHIDGAIYMGCDILVSWDYKNIVNKKNIDRVRKYSSLEIYSPIMLLA